MPPIAVRGLVFLALLLGACGVPLKLRPAAPPTGSANPPAAQTGASPAAALELLPATPAATAVVADLPQPDASPTPAAPLDAPDDLALLTQALAARLNSPAWPALGLPPDLAQAAEDLALRGTPLDPDEAALFEALLAQWTELEGLIADTPGLTATGPVVRVAIFEADARRWPVVYAQAGEDSTAPLYLRVHDRHGQAVGLAPAPLLDGLTQAIGPNGEYVQYRDARGRAVVYADAWPVTRNPSLEDQTLRDKLLTLYGPGDAYSSAEVFPRFVFSEQGIAAAVFGIDRSLSAPQVLLLGEAFDVYQRPDFFALQSGLFGANVSIVLMDRLEQAAGLNYSGTGVIVLDRRDLFGNKYQLAQVLAHEASHVLQGDLPSGGDTCALLLAREVGDQTIAADFLNWDASRLLQAITAEEIGAYHVSLWMLTKQGVRDIDWLYRVIQTGTVNGESLLIDCES